MIYVFQAKQVVMLEHYNTQMVPCSNTGRPKKDIDLKRAICSFSSTYAWGQAEKKDRRIYRNTIIWGPDKERSHVPGVGRGTQKMGRMKCGPIRWWGPTK